MYPNMLSTTPNHLEEYAKIKLGLKKVPANGTEEQYKGLNMQLIRLGSYRGFPNWCKMPPHRLARAGHYYLGTADETECFCCKRRVRNWHEHDRPMEKHQPNCLYLRDRNSVNVPLPGCSDTNDVDMPERIRSVPLPNRIQEDSAQRLYNSTPARHDVPLADAEPGYITEQARMLTFDRWPYNAFVSAEELVQAGFIYLGNGDRVQCVFCKGILRNWKPGDRAFSEHQRHFPQCPFVLNPLRYNMPASAGAATAAAAVPGSFEGAGAINSEGLISNIERLPQRSGNDAESAEVRRLNELGIETDLPRNHQMALLDRRLESFEAWTEHDKQDPEVLAEAGFYFVGDTDSVRCFWCTGGLKNWEGHDDPWFQHARWFPKCGYVKRQKGQAFIDSVQDTAKEDDDRVVDPREVTARMDTPAVKTVLGLGFDKEFVRNVIHYRLAKKGDDFETPAALTETVLNFLENAPRDFPLKKGNDGSGGRAPASGTNSAGGAKKNKKKKDKKKGSAADIAGAINSTGSASRENKDEEPMDVGNVAGSAGSKDGGSTECKVCMSAQVSVVFLPCKHLVCCKDCSISLHTCPLCRGKINATINIYMP